MLEKQITLRIDGRTQRLIEAATKKHQRKFSDMVRLILRENLKKYE